MGNVPMRRVIEGGTGLLLAAAVGFAGCGPGGTPPPEVRGNYALTHEDRLTLKLDVAGAVRERTATGYGEVVDFGTHDGQPVTLDLAAFCGREEVSCPSEVLWSKVAVDQPSLRSPRADAWVLNVVDDTVHDLPAGQRAGVVAGLLNREDRFVLGLGARGEGQGHCAVLAVSLAGGRFSRAGERVETVTEWRDGEGRTCAAPGEDEEPAEGCTARERTRVVAPAGARVDGIKEGRVATAYLGGCAFGPLLVGATLTIESAFTGTRTGDFDPPPFTPLEPDPDLEADET
jgi:hypothetical protein